MAALTRRTRFEIMRNNRPKMAKARETMIERINRIEAEVTAEWNVDHSEQLRAVAENIASARERQLPKPSLLRRALNWTMGMGAAA